MDVIIICMDMTNGYLIGTSGVTLSVGGSATNSGSSSLHPRYDDGHFV